MFVPVHWIDSTYSPIRGPPSFLASGRVATSGSSQVENVRRDISVSRTTPKCTFPNHAPASDTSAGQGRTP